MTHPLTGSELSYYKFVNGRLAGLRSNRYSWWVHWRELADYFLPRRYKWLVTANQQSRGSPINQHIIDSTGVVCARNCAAGIMSGKTSPTRPWFKLTIGRLDNTGTNPVSLWLAECERLMRMVFHESNFYNSIATFYYDLVIYGTAVLLIYEDFDNVINCYNPCAGEYYIDLNGQYRPVIFYREFTLTISAVVKEFGLENCSESVQKLYNDKTGTSLTREIVIGHAIEPNEDGGNFGFNPKFKYREVFWEYGNTSGSQGGSSAGTPGFLRRTGYYEQCTIVCRWDTVSNDPYGRSVAMDALGDQKQLQLESRRKAQAIDKMVNPPMVADIQLKNQPASLLPGGTTYITNYAASGKAGFSSVYDTKFPIGELSEDMAEVRERLKKTFFNDLFQPMSQYETRSNVSIPEVDQRKAESLIMIGPVFERIDSEGLSPIIERVFAMMARANIFPPPPEEIAGKNMNTEFTSMLSVAQNAAESTGIERLLSMAGNLAAVQPGVMDKVDTDFALDKYSTLLNNDPRLMRSAEAVTAIREDAKAQQAAAQEAEMASQMAAGAKTLSETDVGGGANALQAMTGVVP